jgi:hypothetical protein
LAGAAVCFGHGRELGRVGYVGRGLGDVTSQTRDAKSPANHFQPYNAWHWTHNTFLRLGRVRIYMQSLVKSLFNIAYEIPKYGRNVLVGSSLLGSVYGVWVSSQRSRGPRQLSGSRWGDTTPSLLYVVIVTAPLFCSAFKLILLYIMFKPVCRQAARQLTSTHRVAIAGRRHLHAPVAFDWKDPLNVANNYTEEELAIAETAESYCQERMLPRVLGT